MVLKVTAFSFSSLFKLTFYKLMTWLYISLSMQFNAPNLFSIFLINSTKSIDCNYQLITSLFIVQFWRNLKCNFLHLFMKVKRYNQFTWLVCIIFSLTNLCIHVLCVCSKLATAISVFIYPLSKANRCHVLIIFKKTLFISNDIVFFYHNWCSKTRF